jgi:outer membrane protein assembly factor BamB
MIYAIAADGKLHSLNVSSGMEPEPPVDFLPPDANARGLIVLDGVAYAVTDNCNGSASAVWALDLRTKTVAKWQPAAGSIAGSVGPAFGPEGDVYATTDNGELVALDSKTLSVTGTYSSGQPFTSSPVVFPYRGRNLIAAATKDGRIHVLDGASLSGTNPKALTVTSAYSSNGSFAPGALATWQAADGTRWLLAAVEGSPAQASGFSSTSGVIRNGAVAAWRLLGRDENVSLESGWLSRDLVSPLPPVIINGVVFAVSSGESKDGKLSAAERAQRSSPAVIYALDGASGRALWDSGKIITSFVHSGGVSGGAGQIYLQTYDQTLYAFGFPMEH